MDKKIVLIKKINEIEDNHEIRVAIFNLLDKMKIKNKITIPNNANVIIKPNICLVKGYETGVSVDPLIVKYLIDWLLENYTINKIIIGESDATQLNVDIAFKVLGWEHIFKAYPKVSLLNLTKDEYVDININGLYFKNLKMAKSYIEADYFISVAKLKTHVQTGITCVLKNQYGSNPIKYKSQYHPHLDKVIHDLNKVRLPDLCLVDGIIGMEGPGPISGAPKPAGLIIIGNNAVSTDHACAKIMGFNPQKISHLKLAFKKGLGNFEYDVLGEEIHSVMTKFESNNKFRNFCISAYQMKIFKKLSLSKILMNIFED